MMISPTRMKIKLNEYFTGVFTGTDDLNEDPDVKEMDTFWTILMLR